MTQLWVRVNKVEDEGSRQEQRRMCVLGEGGLFKKNSKLIRYGTRAIFE